MCRPVFAYAALATEYGLVIGDYFEGQAGEMDVSAANVGYGKISAMFYEMWI